LTDFQVLTETVTQNATVGWATNCNSCHDLEKHQATEISQCVTCHTDDFTNAEFVRIIHVPHAEEPIFDCLKCHVNSEGNDNVWRLACESCHDGVITNGLPSDHTNYTNDICMGCHGTGALSPDEAHAHLMDIELMNCHTPETTALMQNYPNPFNPSTDISFMLSENGYVTLKIYDVLGSLVETLISNELSAGSYNYSWDASQLSTGIYLYQLQTKNYTQTRKMILLK